MARAATISDLPESLLAHILVALASPEPGVDSFESQEFVANQALSTACLVCKRWRQAVYAEPALWRAFTLRADLLADASVAQQAEWLAATHHLLWRVGRHVEAFTAYKCCAGLADGWCLPQFLRMLRPSKLAALTIHCSQLPAEAVEAVTMFTQLTGLHLGSPNSALPACTARVLQQLSRLQRLRLSSYGADRNPLLRSIGHLTALTYLDVYSAICRLPDAVQLPPLTRLRHLRLCSARLLPPGLAACPQLASYELSWIKVGGVPGFCSASYQPGQLHIDESWWCSRTTPPNQPLPCVLDALLPAGCSALAPVTLLQLSCCKLPRIIQPYTQLSSLEALRLHECTKWKLSPPEGTDSDTSSDSGSDSNADSHSDSGSEEAPSGIRSATLTSLLQQAPRLRELVLEECLAGKAAVLGRVALPHALTRLSLRGNDLETMPAGPYPPALADLDIGANELPRLPPQVLDCTALTRLALDANELLLLTLTDAHQLLQRLPHLARLELGAESSLDPRVCQALADHPGLQLSFTCGDTESEGSTSDTSDGEEEEWGSGAE